MQPPPTPPDGWGQGGGRAAPAGSEWAPLIRSLVITLQSQAAGSLSPPTRTGTRALLLMASVVQISFITLDKPNKRLKVPLPYFLLNAILCVPFKQLPSQVPPQSLRSESLVGPGTHTPISCASPCSHQQALTLGIWFGGVGRLLPGFSHQALPFAFPPSSAH